MSKYGINSPGFELKRTYQRNLLIGIIVVYCAAALLGAAIWLIPSPGHVAGGDVTVVRLPQHPGFASSGNRESASGAPSGKGGSIQADAPERKGFFAYGRKIQVVPDEVVAVAAAAKYDQPLASIPGPEFSYDPGIDDEGAASYGAGGDGDYGLPETPTAIYAGAPRILDWERNRLIRSQKVQPARIYFGGLYWPDKVPAGIECTVYVQVVFWADGHLDWQVQRYAINPGFEGLTLMFKRQLDEAMRRTWFQAGMINGVKVSQVTDLQAVFCRGCENETWTQRGDIQVQIAK